MSMLLPGEEPGAGPARRGLSVGKRKRATAEAVQPCPHLVSTDGKSLPYLHASRRNACVAQPKKKVWQGMRRVTLPHARVGAEKQFAHCLAAFTDCEFYLPPSELDAREAAPAPKAARRPRAAARAPHPEGHHAERHHPKKRPRRRGHARGHMSSAGRQTALQLGAIGLVVMAVAFVVSLLFASEPTQWFEQIALMFVRSNPEALGVSKADLEKAEKAGLLKAGNLKGLMKARGLKGMSAAQRAKLKKAGGLKGLSRSQRAKLKKMLKGRK